MQKWNAKTIGLVFVAAALAGCSEWQENNRKHLALEAAKPDRVAAADKDVFAQNGFDIVASMSESRSTVLNCYTLKKIPDSGVTYVGCARNDSDFKSEIKSLDAIDFAAPKQG